MTREKRCIGVPWEILGRVSGMVIRRTDSLPSPVLTSPLTTPPLTTPPDSSTEPRERIPFFRSPSSSAVHPLPRAEEEWSPSSSSSTSTGNMMGGRSPSREEEEGGLGCRRARTPCARVPLGFPRPCVVRRERQWTETFFSFLFFSIFCCYRRHLRHSHSEPAVESLDCQLSSDFQNNKTSGKRHRFSRFIRSL